MLTGDAYANGARVKVVHLRNALKFMIKVIEGHVAACGRPDAGEPVSLDFLAKLLADARGHADAHEYFLHGMRMAAAGNAIDPPSEDGLAAWRARREQAVEPRDRGARALARAVKAAASRLAPNMLEERDSMLLRDLADSPTVLAALAVELTRSPWSYGGREDG